MHFFGCAPSSRAIHSKARCTRRCKSISIAVGKGALGGVLGDAGTAGVANAFNLYALADDSSQNNELTYASIAAPTPWRRP